jgi:hypothetical protein
MLDPPTDSSNPLYAYCTCVVQDFATAWPTLSVAVSAIVFGPTIEVSIAIVPDGSTVVAAQGFAEFSLGPLQLSQQDPD